MSGTKFWVSCRDCYFCQFDSDGIDVDGCLKIKLLENEANKERFLNPDQEKAFKEALWQLEPQENILCISPLKDYGLHNYNELYADQEKVVQQFKEELHGKSLLIFNEVQTRMRSQEKEVTPA